MEPDAVILVFWMLSFKPNFLLSSFTLNGEFIQNWKRQVLELKDVKD